MSSLRGLGIAGILMLACGIAFGQRDVGDDPSQEVIKELMAHLPNGVKTGKQLPPVIKKALKELANFSTEVEVEALFMRLVVITNRNKYLDYMRVTDPKLRSRIKQRYSAFTLNEQRPIYISSESDLYTAAC